MHAGVVPDDLALSFAAGAMTHVGAIRSANEDSFLTTDLLCVVADGMGGHEAGEIASGVATTSLGDVLGRGLVNVADLVPLLSAVNSSIRELATEGGRGGMGTTVVGAVIAQNGPTQSAVVFNIGDSRCYRLTNLSFEQVTVDHSHVQELVDAGKIDPDAAETHPLRNVVTRALGPDADVIADLFVLEDQDCRLLLCSDGLSGQLRKEAIESTLRTVKDPTEASLALIEAVLTGPAPDNITAVVVDVKFSASSLDDETMPSGLVTETSIDITADRSLTATQVVEALGDNNTEEAPE